jgi:flavocytochrome c
MINAQDSAHKGIVVVSRYPHNDPFVQFFSRLFFDSIGQSLPIQDGCAKMKSRMNSSQNPSKQPDVLIIGSGFAGLTAAIECTQSGLSVVVIEKMKAIGGNSILSDGGIAAPNTALQRRHGIVDTPTAMFEDMMVSAQGLNDPTLCAMVCHDANAAFEWTQDVLGVHYQDRVDVFGGHRIKRCYSPDPLSGLTLLRAMKSRCDALDIPILLGVHATSLITDPKGRVIGVNTHPNYAFQGPPTEDNAPMLAHLAVIVASGGYAADLSFLRALNPQLPNSIQTTNKRSATAEMLKSCMAIGAATHLIETVQWMPWSSPDEPGYGIGGLFGDYIVSASGILIDPLTAQRFVNERADRKIVTERIHQTAPWVIGLADHQAVNDSGWDLSQAVRKGIVVTHPNLTDVATHYQLPHQTLTATLNRVNESITHQTPDPYGRPIEPWMHPLTHPPFYTMRIQPKTHYCPGGLVIDPQLQVLDTTHNPIRGLYAIGEATGMTHGANRLGSCSITECLVMGRRVGQSILRDQNDSVD